MAGLDTEEHGPQTQETVQRKKKTHTTKEQGNASNRLLHFISCTAIGHHLGQQT